MSHLYSFERLNVWQEARLLAKMIYLVTDSYPKSEIFGISSQMRRAAISISSNIAEGCGRRGKRDQAKYYQIAYSSVLELMNQVIISFDLQYIKEIDYQQIRLQLEKVGNFLNTLWKKAALE